MNPKIAGPVLAKPGDWVRGWGRLECSVLTGSCSLIVSTLCVPPHAKLPYIRGML